MIKKFAVIVILFFGSILFVEAQRGCCSHHGGVAGCSSSGRQVCRDGTFSPTCGCTPPKIYGCTDSSADNYNNEANTDDGSCIYKGCTDGNAKNYNVKANSSDGSCLYEHEMIELEEIPFKIVQKSDCTLSEDKIDQIGKNGQKEIIYLVVQNEQGQQVSKMKQSERIILESTNQIVNVASSDCRMNETDTDTQFIIFLLLIVIFFFNLRTGKKYSNDSLLINRIGAYRNWLLYVVYFLCIIPMIIDFFLILKREIRKI